MKLLKTILLSITFISAALLWITRSEYMDSLSAFALSENARFYRLMHISAAFFFLVNALDFKKYATEYALAGGMALILIFDMYNDPVLHYVFTVATLLTACVTLIINSHLKKWLSYSITVAAVVVFLVGRTPLLHFLFAEVIAMALIASGKLTEIYITHKKQ